MSTHTHTPILIRVKGRMLYTLLGSPREKRSENTGERKWRRIYKENKRKLNFGVFSVTRRVQGHSPNVRFNINYLFITELECLSIQLCVCITG